MSTCKYIRSTTPPHCHLTASRLPLNTYGPWQPGCPRARARIVRVGNVAAWSVVEYLSSSKHTHTTRLPLNNHPLGNLVAAWSTVPPIRITLRVSAFPPCHQAATLPRVSPRARARAKPTCHQGAGSKPSEGPPTN